MINIIVNHTCNKKQSVSAKIYCKILLVVLNILASLEVSFMVVVLIFSGQIGGTRCSGCGLSRKVF